MPSEWVFGIPVIIWGVVQLWQRYLRKLRKRRTQFIERYIFPNRVIKTLKTTYPALSDEQAALIMQGLRQYFQLCLCGQRRIISMPSQAVDVAWHELILFTKTYQLFCKQAFGRFLHHIPAEAMSSPTQAQAGIKRAWRLACMQEGINPMHPARLPLLFAIDAMLKIPNGFYYALDCQSAGAYPYCGSHIGCGTDCAGTSGGDSGDSDSGSCGGSCGGD